MQALVLRGAPDARKDWDSIPRALRACPQWCVAGLHGADEHQAKRPLSPVTNRWASVNEPRDFGTFEQACALAKRWNGHVGFILTPGDPFFCVDLDYHDGQDAATSEAQDRIAAKLGACYIERSASGRGLHLWGRTVQPLPSAIKTGTVEIYDTARFIICTGNVVHAGAFPDLTGLVHELHGVFAREQDALPQEGGSAIYSDDEVLEKCRSSRDGEKFEALWGGEYKGDYPSRSEADNALIWLLCFAAGGGSLKRPIDDAQIVRLFQACELGQRKKATAKYIARSVDGWRKKIGAPLPDDFELAVSAAPKPAAPSVPKSAPKIEAAKPVEPKTAPSIVATLGWPPGIVGDIAQWGFAEMFRPLEEAAIVAALSFVSGIAGRSYCTHTGLGLALYMVIVAPRSSGKEGLGEIHDELFEAVKKHVPTVRENFDGGSFASGQALVRKLRETPVFVSVWDEFGLHMQRLLDPKANDANRALVSELMAIYSKGGPRRCIGEKAYADDKKKLAAVFRPNPTIVGSTVMDNFLPKISRDRIEDGLLPRFLILERKTMGGEMRDREMRPPPSDLVGALGSLANGVVAHFHEEPQVVEPTSEARALLKAFARECETIALEGGARAGLFSRAHAHALKVACVLAIGAQQPRVTAVEAQWAVNFVRYCVNGVATHYEEGTAGSVEGLKIDQIEKFLVTYLASPGATMRARFKAVLAAHEAGVIQSAVLWRAVHGAFEDNHRAFSQALEGLRSRGRLVPVQDSKRKQALGLRSGDAYQIVEDV